MQAVIAESKRREAEQRRAEVTCNLQSLRSTAAAPAPAPTAAAAAAAAAAPAAAASAPHSLLLPPPYRPVQQSCSCCCCSLSTARRRAFPCGPHLSCGALLLNPAVSTAKTVPFFSETPPFREVPRPFDAQGLHCLTIRGD